ncbi:hypothetical protein BGX27_000505 [Mortierella sp. AM989]|nr:hypothetical protein BGX27_000505 [Mortierella sp. AM989]
MSRSEFEESSESTGLAENLHGANYFLDLANPDELTPKGYTEYRRAEAPYIRNKEIVEEWQGWVVRLGGNPKWKDAFMRTKTFTLNSFRAWRKKAPQAEITVGRTRSSSKRATTSQSFVSPDNPPSSEEHLSLRCPVPSPTLSSSSSPSLPPPESLHQGTESSSQSTGSSDSLSSEAVQQLRAKFNTNFNDYPGESWKLSTGTNVDEAIRRYTMTLRTESSLHSFIVDDIDAFRPQFTAEDFDLFLSQVQSFDSQVNTPVLPAQVQQEILKYSLAPDVLQDYLSRGWRQDDNESQDGDDFRRSLYITILRLSCIYEENQGVIPGSKSESWYATEVWAIFIKLLTRNSTWLRHEPGEVYSFASALRKNKGRNLDTRHAVGSKLDGLISCDETQHEIASIEMGRIDAGATGTKALGDGVKLAKDLKDMYENICTQCHWSSEEGQGKLHVFGLLISGLRVEFITLCRMKGRYYRLRREETISVPSKWTENSIRKILVIVTKFLHFRARMEEMSKLIDEWDNPDANELENIVSGSARPTVRQPFGRTMALTPKTKRRRETSLS